MTYGETLAIAAKAATAYLDGLAERRISASASASEMRNRFKRDVPMEGLPARRVIEELLHLTEGGILGSQSDRFFAWVIGGTLPSALAADWLTSAWDQNAAIYATGPAAAIVEEVAGIWLKQLLELPESASFAFVTGCQMAHLTCLAAARHHLLDKCNWDVEQRGLNGAPKLRIISSIERHGSIDRAVRFLGFGQQALHLIQPEGASVSAKELEDALAQSNDPAIVLLQAADINTGAFDDFASLVPLARDRGAWVHVDGAFGLWAATSPEYKQLLAGVELADSWATDGHKWLNVPFDSGYAFVAHPDAHREAMSIRAPYISAASEARDQIDWNPDWSRRARGSATYAAIRELGREGIAGIIERSCAAAKAIVTGLAQLPGVEIVGERCLNQGLVRFISPSSRVDDDTFTEAVIERIAESGEAFFGPTTWRGKRAMRVSVVNASTNPASVDRTLAAVQHALQTTVLHM